MRDPRLPPTRHEAAESDAARWALRCAEGLTAEQELEFADWLAADPRHAQLLAEYRAAWARFEPLAEIAEVTAEPARRPPPAGSARTSWRRPALAAAAALALGWGWWAAPARLTPDRPAAAGPVAVLPAPCEQRVLPDGTVVELNRTAEIAVEFAAGLRRVDLVRGEARFAVATDPARPFIVVAGAIEAHAVGTEFNVRREAANVEVVVTEGRVRVADPRRGTTDPRAAVELAAGQHVVVAGDAPVAEAGVRNLSADELERRLAWQSRLIEFDAAPLADVVAAFNRRNPIRLVIDDPGLAAERMTATFRSDNVESFVRLLEANYGIAVTAGAPGAIHLSRR